MKVANPKFLVPSAPAVPTAPVDSKALPVTEKKMILRKNIRIANQKQNVNYGWRSKYKQSNNVFTKQRNYGYMDNDSSIHDHHDYHHDSHDDWRYEGRYRRNNDYDYYGPDYMMYGGLIIIGNPWDPYYINQPDFGDHLHHGFYDDVQINNYNDIHIDDMADWAGADTDLMGHQDLGDYGANDLGIDDPGNDLGIHEDMADLQGDNGVDFQNDDFGGNDGYDANDLGNAYEGKIYEMLGF